MTVKKNPVRFTYLSEKSLESWGLWKNSPCFARLNNCHEKQKPGTTHGNMSSYRTLTNSFAHLSWHGHMIGWHHFKDICKRIHSFSLSWKVKASRTKNGWSSLLSTSLSRITYLSFFSLIMCLFSRIFTEREKRNKKMSQGLNNNYMQSSIRAFMTEFKKCYKPSSSPLHLSCQPLPSSPLPPLFLLAFSSPPPTRPLFLLALPLSPGFVLHA